MTTAMPAIELKDLSKKYKGSDVFALRNVSLQVKQGEIYGFLGANGAGKTTAIRTLLNFLQPTGGTATILGKDIVKDSLDIKHHVGYLAGDVALYDKLTGKEFLTYMAEIHPPNSVDYMKTLIKDFETPINQRLGALSKGNRQKIGIIQAMMHEPEVLIMDEPTSGLDPLMQEMFFDHIKYARDRGASVFFSSHNLAEVQRICDRIGFLDRGKLLREQSLAELAQSAALTFDIIFDAKAPLHELRQVKGSHVVPSKHNPRLASVSLPVTSFQEFFGLLSKCNITQFSQREVNLGEEFMEYYREANRGQK